MIDRTISIDELKNLWSYDHPCRVGELSRSKYLEDKHLCVFDDLVVDIQKNGITTPLRVANCHLIDGHHRAIVAMELGLVEIPITYEGNLRYL